MPAPTAPDAPFPPGSALEVRDRCLCLRAQRAARALARRFDAAFRPFGITNGQFSLLMATSGAAPPTAGALAEFLGMDRTTLTAALKPLGRRGLAEERPDPDDRRRRRVAITPAGRALLAEALPVWRAEHDALDALLADPAAARRAAEDVFAALGTGRAHDAA